MTLIIDYIFVKESIFTIGIRNLYQKIDRVAFVIAYLFIMFGVVSTKLLPYKYELNLYKSRNICCVAFERSPQIFPL